MTEHLFKDNNKQTARKQTEQQDRETPTTAHQEDDAARLVNLQRVLGNQGVQRLLAGQSPRGSTFVQTKLTVGPANDVYEQEADRVARQVMNAQQPVQREAEEEELQAKRLDIQRAGEEEELQMQRADIRRQAPEEEELQAKRLDIQRAEEEEELQAKRLDIQRKGTEGGFEVGGQVEEDIKAHKGNGEPLPDDARNFFESRFDQDFSGVNVHADAQSDALNRSLAARAFTSGSDIFFRQGEFNPGTQVGKELIGHELTHVVQQGGSVQKKEKGEE